MNNAVSLQCKTVGRYGYTSFSGGDSSLVGVRSLLIDTTKRIGNNTFIITFCFGLLLLFTYNILKL